jgi:hypothetical protein
MAQPREPPLRLVRVHELLGRKGIEVGYTTLRRFPRKELGWQRRPATVLLADPPPGQETHAVFGRCSRLPPAAVLGGAVCYLHRATAALRAKSTKM